VVQQLLTESLVLAAAGSLVGLAIAYGMTAALIALAPSGTPRLDEVTMDGGVFLFAAALTLVTGLLFGAAPAFQAARASLSRALGPGGRAGIGGGHRLRRALVVVEVAAALVLLAGGGLLLRTVAALSDADLGFRPDRVLVGFVAAPAADYPTEAHRRAFLERVLDRASALPGVEMAAATSVLPLAPGDSDMSFAIEGQAAAASPADEPVTWYRLVSANYFEAMGIPIRRGRAFAPGEAAPVVVVNESLARRYWPGQDAIGRRMRFGDDAAPWFTVVGVAADVRQQGPRLEPRLQTFLPYWQLPELAGGMNLVLRTSSGPEQVAQPLRDAVRGIDPDIPVAGLTTMAATVRGTLDEPRFLASLVAVFAALAAIVAAIGVFGLMAYVVAGRRGELGVRVALGAARGDIFSLVIGDGVRLALAGIALGVGGGLALAPALEPLLFGVRAADPATFAATAAGVIVVALVATAVPARRAMRVDPAATLKTE
jgi:predicted permease